MFSISLCKVLASITTVTAAWRIAWSLYPADCPCPTCKTTLKADDIKKPQRMLVNLLNATLVRCAICKALTKHEFLDNHEKNCLNYRIGLQEATGSYRKLQEATEVSMY
jgi:LSD1 subclass zinc finger protein